MARRAVGALAAILSVGLAVDMVAYATAQGTEGVVYPTAKRLYVAGEDVHVQVEASLPLSCAGADVAVGLFERGGAASVNQTDALFEVGRATATADGRAVGSVRIPANLPRSLRTLWPGVTGACLKTPVVSTGPGLLFGVRDPVENPGSASTYVIPASSLFMGRTVQVATGTYSVFANGKLCTTVDLEDSAVKDEEGNLRIHLGRAGQPTECSIAGATVTFRSPRGEELYENRTLVPGVSQPFANLAPKAGPSSGPPIAPDTGNAGPRTPGHANQWPVIGLALASAGSIAVLFLRGDRRRRL